MIRRRHVFDGTGTSERHGAELHAAGFATIRDTQRLRVLHAVGKPGDAHDRGVHRRRPHAHRVRHRRGSSFVEGLPCAAKFSTALIPFNRE